MLAKQQVVLTAIPIPDDYERQEGEEDYLFWVTKGNRRLEGGRKLKLETMLCLVDLTMAGDRAGLFIDQLVENDGDFRLPLSAFEQAQALFQGHQAGASRTELRQRTGRTKAQISAGIAAGRLSERTKRAARAMNHVWTLDDIASLSEFDGDDAALARIQQRIDWGHPVAYAVETVRDELAEEAEHNRILATLEQAGVRVSETRPPEALLLQILAHIVDGFDPEPDQHAACAGHGAFFYSYNSLNRSSSMVEAHATKWANRRTRLHVAREMYRMRFPEEDPDRLTRHELLGREGHRVKDCYRRNAARVDLPWNGRVYIPGDFSATDPLNQAVTAAAQCMYGIAQTTVTALGCAPGLGLRCLEDSGQPATTSRDSLSKPTTTNGTPSITTVSS